MNWVIVLNDFCKPLKYIIIRFIAHHVQDGYTLVENTLMTIKKPLGEKGITEQMGHRN